MKYKMLITALMAIGLSLSGVSHAVPLSITKPDGTKTVANVEGNKLMLRDATGKLWLPAGNGTYKTNDGKTLIVQRKQRGYAASNFAIELDNPKEGIIAPIDSKAKGKGGIVGPMFNPPASPMKQGPDKLLPAVQKPSASGMGSPAATQRGLLMQKNKPGNVVAPGSPGYKASTLGGQGPTSVQTTPMPQGTQSRASSKSPKGPSGPEGSVPPSQ